MTFEEFAAARLPALLRYATVLTGDRELAEDLVQEVMIRMHLRWRRVQRVDRPELYVKRAVTNEFLVDGRRGVVTGSKANIAAELQVPWLLEIQV